MPYPTGPNVPGGKHTDQSVRQIVTDRDEIERHYNFWLSFGKDDKANYWTDTEEGREWVAKRDEALPTSETDMDLREKSVWSYWQDTKRLAGKHSMTHTGGGARKGGAS